MKILVIDVDQNEKKFNDFFSKLKEIISAEFEIVPNPTIPPGEDYIFAKFSQAGFNLENFLMKNNYFSKNREYHLALLVWGDYPTENLKYIQDFVANDVLTEDLILFEHTSRVFNHNWVFGDITALINWSGSLFKLDKSMFDTTGRDSYMNNEIEFNKAIWFAIRIGLKVYGVNENIIQK